MQSESEGARFVSYYKTRFPGETPVTALRLEDRKIGNSSNGPGKGREGRWFYNAKRKPGRRMRPRPGFRRIPLLPVECRYAGQLDAGEELQRRPAAGGNVG